jgi:4-hydroxy-3-methylbut-2-enyl diphosphate reductase IspH
VHNRYVVEGLQNLGAVFIEELNEIPAEHRDAPVVFSAHGVPKSVPADAEARNLFTWTPPVRWCPRCTSRLCATSGLAAMFC